jgi:hypothetical protein
MDHIVEDGMKGILVPAFHRSTERLQARPVLSLEQ